MHKWILAVGWFIAAPAIASDWVYVTAGTDGAVYYADRETSENDGNFAWVWVKSDLSKVKSTNLRSTKELWRFNCKKKTSITVSFIAYNADGSIAKSRSFDADNQYLYDPVAPDTIGWRFMADVCAGLG